MNFTKIAPYLNDPMVLIGFVIFLFFSFCRYLVKKKIIPELPAKFGFLILKQILLYGFIFGILIIALAFGLKYKSLAKEEQNSAFLLLKNELTDNIKITLELTKNMEHIIEKQQIVSDVLRIDGIDIMNTLFPEENIMQSPSHTVQELVDISINELATSGLLNDDFQLRKFNAAGNQIRTTIENTIDILKSLQDEKGLRYPVNTTIWDSNLEIYRKINLFDVLLFQKAISEQKQLRTNYEITVKHAIDYLDLVKDFFEPGSEITKEKLYKVLSKERFTIELVNSYSNSLRNSADELKNIENKISSNLN